MAVVLRLRRMGTTKRAFYRIVATDASMPRDGRFLEIVGYYNPLTNPATIKINEEKAVSWINKGAKPSEAVKDLFKKTGLLKNLHESKVKAKTKVPKENPAEEKSE